jgi:hypothetical protein
LNRFRQKETVDLHQRFIKLPDRSQHRRQKLEIRAVLRKTPCSKTPQKALILCLYGRGPQKPLALFVNIVPLGRLKFSRSLLQSSRDEGFSPFRSLHSTHVHLFNRPVAKVRGIPEESVM